MTSISTKKKLSFSKLVNPKTSHKLQPSGQDRPQIDHILIGSHFDLFTLAILFRFSMFGLSLCIDLHLPS